MGWRICDEAVREAVIVVWEASDRICGKRPKVALPNLVDFMERHGHLKLDPEVKEPSVLSQCSHGVLVRCPVPLSPRDETISIFPWVTQCVAISADPVSQRTRYQ